MMQRGWNGIGLALAATLALAGSASAQFGPPGGGPPGGPRGGAMLLRIPEVQTELKLTDEQKTKVDAMLERFRGQRGGPGAGFRDLSPEEREKQFAERRASEQKEVKGIMN